MSDQEQRAKDLEQFVAWITSAGKEPTLPYVWCAACAYARRTPDLTADNARLQALLNDQAKVVRKLSERAAELEKDKARLDTLDKLLGPRVVWCPSQGIFKVHKSADDHALFDPSARDALDRITAAMRQEPK